MKSSSKKSRSERPSGVTDAYWVCAERKTGQYPEATERSGKWLIFVPVERIDEVWERIRIATEEGRLGDSAKAATARSNPNATDRTKKVICVYTYDWQDREKADVDTDAGRYRVAGHTRISKYYE
jgi:hypothetical protein